MPFTLAVLPCHSEHWLLTLNWSPSSRQQQQFQTLYQKICEANRSINLTRITEPDEFWEKHLWDSLSGVQSFLQQPFLEPGELSTAPEDLEQAITESEQGSAESVSGQVNPSKPESYRVLDIGSGAGFPGLPIAIAFPHWSISLLDSTRKKIAFCQGILADVGLTNVRTLADRAETLGRDPQHRHCYDLVTIRAVATAAACAEYALPFLKINGKAVLYRGRWAEFELTELKKALKKLGGEVEDIRTFMTPLSGGDRHCIVIHKTTKTPKAYPRAVGIPTKTPLG